ncbi:ECF-type sigma factor [Pseudomarimonas salicorniae]|uniref:ECF-type sigma factor n=1 Tax=Pseudomarimonas salicorniae TaxID=2933270 RepID=A0ABT0GCA2_9GAMM|nr:ECF-type sigma factor [Lysobacter sp. CAU 1642]MCK7592178.1 ECF-type sigma factor [Lysobacter sp. CAU 1642]
MPEDFKPNAVTELLGRSRQGDAAARSRLMALVYGQLKELASRHMRGEGPVPAMQTTELVHEAYLQMFSGQVPDWPDRRHFFSYASTVMRHLLVAQARQRLSQKRGGDLLRVSLSHVAHQPRDSELVALDQALSRLAAIDARKSDIIVMRFFGGLSIDEICAVTELSPATIHAEIKAARGWLFQAIEGP